MMFYAFDVLVTARRWQHKPQLFVLLFK